MSEHEFAQVHTVGLHPPRMLVLIVAAPLLLCLGVLIAVSIQSYVNTLAEREVVIRGEPIQLSIVKSRSDVSAQIRRKNGGRSNFLLGVVQAGADARIEFDESQQRVRFIYGDEVREHDLQP